MSRHCRGTWTRAFAAAAIACVVLPLATIQSRGETLESALVQAYQNNPSLNSQRAATRAIDENVPQALSGYRPKVAITANGGEQTISQTAKSGTGVGATYSTLSGYNSPASVGGTITQTLFNGFQTASKTRQAESTVLAQRATLRVNEQTVLLAAATAYMNVLRDNAILDLQRRNVEVLQEQLRQTRDRFTVGEVTRTDVAQAESSLAAGRSQVLSAEANAIASAATYRQVIGTTAGKLTSATPVDRFSPRSVPAAVDVGITLNPAVTSAHYNVDVAEQAVRVAEGALYPTLSVQGAYQKNWLSTAAITGMDSYSASILGTLSVPIYQGGAEYSLIRQAKETLGQKRIDLDTARDTVRQAVVQAWGQLEAAKATNSTSGVTDQINNAEVVQFADTAIFNVASSSEAAIVNMYEAALDRAPDAGGFQFWLSQFRSGQASLSTIANAFIKSSEFAADHGTISNSQLLNVMYENTLDRAPTQSELTSWLSEISSQHLSQADIVVAFAETPLTQVKAVGIVHTIDGLI